MTVPCERANTMDAMWLSDRLMIRRARAHDAEAIADIARAVNVHDFSRYGRGFIVYTLSAREYAERTLNWSCVYLFIREGRTVGYVCGCRESELQYSLSAGALDHQPCVCGTIQRMAQERRDKHYLFLEQIAILPEFQDRGIGEVCFCWFCDRHAAPFYVGMLEGPVRNPRIDYWQKRGFERIGQATESLPERFLCSPTEPAASRRLLWGIYILSDRSFRPMRGRVLGDALERASRVGAPASTGANEEELL